MVKDLRRFRQKAAAEGTAGNELRAALKQCRVSVWYLMAFGLGYNVLFLATPLYSLQIFDRYISSGHFETLVMLTIFAAIALAFMGALEAIRGFILARVARWLDRSLSPKLISWSIRGRLLGLPSSTQPLRELGLIRAFIGGQAITALCDVPWVPIFLAVVWLIHPWLAVLGFIAAAGLFSIAVLNEFVSRRPLKEATRLSNENVRSAELAIRNADVFRSMGMLSGFLAGWLDRNDQALDLQLKANDRNSILFGFTKSFRLFVQVLLMGIAAFLVVSGQMTAGGIIAVSMLISRALSPFEQAIGGWKIFLSARDAYERLTKLLDLVPAADTKMRLPAARGHLACESVSFTPHGQSQAILNGVSFAVEPGTILGVIGPSAAGKSTLCRILVGISQPTRGHARLDGADFSAWPADQLGRAIGYLPQEVELYEGKISTNIARLQANFDPDAVVEAAKVAGIHDMILRLPDGYETEIGEAGGFLSGGQRQRIGLARALYGRPQLIVLDEPNASLDAEGEASLINAIKAAKGWGATVIVVAHQPHVLKPADMLLVVRGGTVQLFGPRDEVLRTLRVMREHSEDGKRTTGQPVASTSARTLHVPEITAVPETGPASLPPQSAAGSSGQAS